MVLVESPELRHLVCRQLEVKYGEVFLESLRDCRSWG